MRFRARATLILLATSAGLTGLASPAAPMTALTPSRPWADTAAPDTTAPVVSSTGVADGGWLALYNNLTPVYSDDVAVTKLQVLVNGSVVATHDGTIPSEVRVTTPTPGLHNKEALLTVRAFDAAGNQGEATTRVRVDVLSPDAVITPGLESVVSGVVTLTATEVPEDGRLGDLVRVEVVDNGGRLLAQATSAPWQMTWDTRGGPSGNTRVSITLFDRADNASVRMGYYRVDNVGPSIKKITPGHHALVRGTVRTTVQATDVSGIHSAQVKGGTATESPFTWTVSPTQQGPHTIEWTVTDRLGHTTVASRVVINDTVKPTLKVTKAPKNGAKVKGTVKVTASATDRNGIRRVELLVNGKVVAKDAKAGYAFSVKTSRYGKRFTVRLRAYDKAGNVKLSPVRTWRR